MILKAYIGNIVSCTADAIVNAAHPSLEGGGGVDGVVHRAAGPELKEACMAFPVLEVNPEATHGRTAVRCKTGDARITPAFNLPNNHVVHTPGPVYADYTPAEAAELLKRCYQRSLYLAVQSRCKSIAFPAISTGIFGYPLEDATIVAVNTCLDFNSKYPDTYGDVVVHFVCFDEANFLVYDRVIDAAKRGWRQEFNTRAGVE